MKKLENLSRQAVTKTESAKVVTLSTESLSKVVGGAYSGAYRGYTVNY